MRKIKIASRNYSNAATLAHHYNGHSYHTYWQASTVNFWEYFGVPCWVSCTNRTVMFLYILNDVDFCKTWGSHSLWLRFCLQEHDNVLAKWFLMFLNIIVPLCSGSKKSHAGWRVHCIGVVGVATQRSKSVSTPNLPASTLRPLPLLPLMACHQAPVTHIPIAIYFVPHNFSWTDQPWRRH